jgi:hypothetical protein
MDGRLDEQLDGDLDDYRDAGGATNGGNNY